MEKPLHEMSAAMASITSGGKQPRLDRKLLIPSVINAVCVFLTNKHKADEANLNGTAKHSPPKLPNELWQMILWPLEQQDIKNARLAWRRWVDLGFRMLFRPFVFRPDRYDFDRLDRVLEHGLPSGSINSLRFEYGTIDIRTMAKALAYEYMTEYNDQRILNVKELYPGLSTYSEEELELEKTNAVLEYASWAADRNTATRDLASRIEAAFSKLDNLERIEIIYRGVPFKNNLLLTAWVQEIGGNNFGTTNMEFGQIVHSLLKSKSLLKHLSHDKLPVSYFIPECNSNFMLQPSICTELQTLHLTFVATAPPHMKFWEHLGAFLRTAPRLNDLWLGFDSFDARFVEGSGWQQCGTNGYSNWYLPLWKFLGEYHWQQLTILRLEGLVVCEKGLSDFLIRHCKTLRSLDLSSIGLWQGSFQGFLSGVRPFLKLDNFCIRGMLEALHYPDESWDLPSTADDFPDSWSPEYASVMKDFAWDDWASDNVVSGTRTRDLLGLFMQSTTDWPLNIEDAHARGFSHQPSECCAMIMKAIDAHWVDGLRKPLQAWKDFRFRSGEQVNTGREIIESYSDDGFDDHGFDKDGYNGEGVHYRDAPYNFDGAVDPMHPSAAERGILISIVEAISKKAEVSEQIGDYGGVWRRWISIGPKKV
jgi:hypothetical protein